MAGEARMSAYYPEKLKGSWDFAKGIIEKATRYGVYSIEQVEEKVLNLKWCLWCGEKSAVVTEEWIGDLGRCVTINFAGGDISELLVMYENIELAARSAGCVKIFISGRSGWKRVFRDKGFKDENLIGKEL